MAQKKSDISNAQKLGIGVGLTAAAVAAAGAYFLYGSKGAAKNRKVVKSWAIKAKGEVLEAIEKAEDSTQDFLNRHESGDWGDVCREDWQSNDQALDDGSRLFSVYRTRLEERLWIITEADRSFTTVLLPYEY